MNAPRVDPFSFNPEKFLAEDSKKEKQTFGFPPICFSSEAKKIFFDRLTREFPIALCQNFQPDEFKAGLAALKEQLQREIRGMGLPDDHTLFAFLFADVLHDLLAMRDQKGPPKG